MKKLHFLLFAFCCYIQCFAAISVTNPAGANIDQFDSIQVQWTCDDISAASTVAIILQQNGSDYQTLATGQANIVGASSYSWSVTQNAGSNYAVKVVSEDDGLIFDTSSTFAIVAPTISVSAADINQFDDLDVSWSVTGVISNNVDLEITENGETATVNDNSGSHTFATDNSATWAAGSYTITATSIDQPSISGTANVNIGASSISSVAVSDIDQYDTLSVSWTETGNVGSTVTITASTTGFSDSKTIAVGSGSTTFTTDNTWPAGSYTVTVASDDYGALTANDTCTVSASGISAVSAGDIDQFDTLSVSWTETGNIGSTVTITASTTGFSDNKTIAVGAGSTTFTTDNTWPAGSYTITVASDDYGVLTANDTCTVSASSISAVSAGDINQFDTLSVSWTETGNVGSTVTITASTTGFSDNKTIAVGAGSTTFTTDNTWPAGSYTITVASDDYGVLTANDTCTVSASSISAVSAGDINQFDTLSVSWTETGNVGSTITITASTTGFSDNKTIAVGSGSTTFTTDNTWPAGSYTVTVASDDYGVLTANDTCTVSASSISGVSASDINQFDTLSVSWTETGNVGSTITITASTTGFSDNKTIAVGAGSTTFTTDNTWPAGSYTITVASDDYGVLTANDTCTVSASSISAVSAGDINQFDTLSVSWTETGNVGSTITITASTTGFSDNKTIAVGSGSTTFTTDNTWPAGSYTITVTSDDYGVLTANDTATISQSAISNISASAINQYDNLVVTWSETGTLGANVQIVISQGGFSDSVTVSAGTLTASFATDNTWPTGSCTITITPVTYPLAAETSTVTINPTTVTLDAIAGINQFDTLAVSWSESGSVGASTKITVANGGFSQTTTVAAGTLAANFSTDNTWPTGSYTVTAVLVDHTAVTSSKSFTLSQTAISINAQADINQFDTLNVSWTESGSIGATVDIAVKLGGSTITTAQIAAGTGSWSTATDNTWATGTYTVELTATDHAVITSSDTFVLSVTDITLAAVSNINQFDDIDLSWSYQGSYGNNVTINIVRQSDSATVSTQTIASTNTTAAIATDNSATWPAGNYTATITLADHPAMSSSKSFTISPTEVITIATAVDGSSINQLDSLAITWSTTGSFGNVRLDLYKAGSLVRMINGNTADDGNYLWPMPLTISPDTGYYIKISSMNHPSAYKDTAITFDVNETSITVNANSDITQFDDLTVNWTSTGSVGATVSISVISTANGTIATAASQSTASGSYTFSSDLNWVAASDYYVEIVSDQYGTCIGQNSAFTVNPTSVSINAIADINQLDSQTVTWNKVGNFGTNTIFELYLGGSLIDQQILAANTYSFSTDMSWTVGTYIVKVISQDHTTCYATETFVLNRSVIGLLEPVEVCYWRRGATQRISWESTGTAGATLTINVYQASVLIATATATANNSAEEYFWTVPTSLSAGVYNIKVISNLDNQLTSNFSSDITLTDNSFGGYIYSDSGDPYGSGIEGVDVEITSGSSTMTVETNSVGYWSTPEMSLGDYTVKPTLPRRYFEKSAAPDAGDYSTVYTLATSGLAASHSINFLSGYKVVFITPTGAGSKNGLSWSNAGDDIQAAIDQASLDPDDRYEEVWVKKGAYSGPLVLKDYCTVVGGFSGVEDPSTFNINKRDLVNNISILSGDGGSGHIVDGSDSTGYAVIDGFYLSGNSSSIGAGLYLENSILTVNNCSFYKNATTNVGGGVGCLNSTLLLNNCLFQGNTSANSGGAVYASAGSDLLIYNCTFSGCFAPWLGAAVFAKNNSSISMRSCTVASSLSYGGSAVEVENSSSLSMDNTLLYYNSNFQGQTTSAQYQYDSSSSASVSSCYIQSSSSAIPQFFAVPDSGNGTWGDGDDDYGDLHLMVSSPCIDRGSGSGATTYDRDGDLRKAGNRLDIGSDECHFESAVVNSGASVTVTPVGDGTAQMYEETFITLDNTAGASGSTIDVVQISDNIHPEQDAYRVVGATVVVETSLADGDYEMTLVIPFSYDDLGGADWTTINLSYFDVNTQSWANAGTGSYWQEQATAPTMTQLRARPLGDYGVYWNSSKLKGFAWANVDHTTDYAPLIYTRDFDFDRNGIVDVADLTEFMFHWQLISTDEHWEDRYDISQEKDGIVNLEDFYVLALNWLN